MSKLKVFAFLAIYLVTMTGAAAKPPADRGKQISASFTAPDPKGSPIMLSQKWDLTFRLEVRDAVAVVFDDNVIPGTGAFVMRDADDCLTLSAFPYVSEDGPFNLEYCDPPIDNETYIQFDTHPRPPLCTPFGSSFLIPNHAYLLLPDPEDQTLPSEIRPVGASSEPCRGFHENLDFTPRPSLPSLQSSTQNIFGLVVMADVGGARVFDEHFDLIGFTPDGTPIGPWDPESNGRAIRNMAGLVDHVGSEYLYDRNKTAITGTMQIDGDFSPIFLVDLSVADPDIDAIRRRESGSIVSGSCDPVGECDGELHEVTVRIVLVEGPAPLFVVDANRDGEFTARDLAERGFTLLSNQAEFRVTTRTGAFTTDRFVYLKDFDGDGLICRPDFNCPSDPDSSRGGARVRR